MAYDFASKLLLMPSALNEDSGHTRITLSGAVAIMGALAHGEEGLPRDARGHRLRRCAIHEADLPEPLLKAELIEASDRRSGLPDSA
jgi:hypothetical protein